MKSKLILTFIFSVGHYRQPILGPFLMENGPKKAKINILTHFFLRIHEIQCIAVPKSINL
jgi:hypothetical protein